MDGLRSGTSTRLAPPRADTRYFHAAPAAPRSGVTPTDTTEPEEALERKEESQVRVVRKSSPSHMCGTFFLSFFLFSSPLSSPPVLFIYFFFPLSLLLPPTTPLHYTQQLIGALTPPESHRLNSRIATAVLRAVQRAENGCAQLMPQ